jgi:hypothetical protein
VSGHGIARAPGAGHGPADGPPTLTARLGSLVPVAALAAAAGAGFSRVFGWEPLPAVLGVAAVVPVVIVALVSGRRNPPPLWPSVLLTAVGWLAVVSATLFRADAAGSVIPTARTLNLAVAGITDAWKAILTTILPAPAEPELLVLAHACVWLAAFAGAELALRTRSAVLPALPALGTFGVALLLGVRGDGSLGAVTAALVGIAALLVLLRSPTRPPLLRGLVIGLPYLACLTLVAVLAGPHLPFAQAREPFDPSTRVQPPEPERPPSVNPLDQVSAWLQQPEKPLFTVAATKSSDWRLAVLDRFDGTSWTAGVELNRSGGRIPAPAGVPSTEVAQRITIEGLTGVWLPAADRPTSVEDVTGVAEDTGREVAVDRESGVIAMATPLRPGVSYRVVSRVPRYELNSLQFAPTADDPEARRDSLLPGAPDGRPIPALATLRRLAKQATEDSTFPFQQAVHLADWLRTRNTYDPNAVSGHSYRHLEFFLNTTGRGTSEHFATAFAVMGRTLGMPTRVVVGFRPGERAGDRWRVRSGDVLVWPEVNFSGVGWVPFYPTPGNAGAAGRAAVPAGGSAERQEIDEQVAGTAQKAQTPPPAPPSPDAQGGGQGLLPPWWVLTLAGLAVLGTGYLLLALLAPYRRRRRRRRARTARGQVLGAWAQSLDRLRDVGLPRGGALTAEEVAAFGVATVGDEAGRHLPVLARMMNEVVYAEAAADRAMSETAWRHCDAVEKLVERQVPRSRRARLRLDPRSLRAVEERVR